LIKHNWNLPMSTKAQEFKTKADENKKKWRDPKFLKERALSYCQSAVEHGEVHVNVPFDWLHFDRDSKEDRALAEKVVAALKMDGFGAGLDGPRWCNVLCPEQIFISWSNPKSAS
jgi:hypothetical protein